MTTLFRRTALAFGLVVLGLFVLPLVGCDKDPAEVDDAGRLDSGAVREDGGTSGARHDASSAQADTASNASTCTPGGKCTAAEGGTMCMASYYISSLTTVPCYCTGTWVCQL